MKLITFSLLAFFAAAGAQASTCAIETIGGECHTLSLPKYYDLSNFQNPKFVGFVQVRYQYFPATNGEKHQPVVIRLSARPIKFSEAAVDDLQALADVRKTHAVVIYDERSEADLHMPPGPADFHHNLVNVRAKDTEHLVSIIRMRSDVDTANVVLYSENNNNPGSLLFAHKQKSNVTVVLSTESEFGDLDGEDIKVSKNTDDESEFEKSASDPMEKMNRLFFDFNMWLDANGMSHVVKFYKFVTPEAVQKGIKNFSDNLTKPITFYNQILQAELLEAAKTLSRFVIDTVVGVAGFFNISEDVLGKQIREDFGQTLGVWGVGEGFYLVLPFLGPSGGRDFTGYVVDNAVVSPMRFVPYLNSLPSTLSRSFVEQLVNYRGDEIDFVRKGSVDFYKRVRHLYRKQRALDIKETKTKKLEVK